MPSKFAPILSIVGVHFDAAANGKATQGRLSDEPRSV